MNIYVGNLSRDVTEEDLRAAFEAFGRVETVNVITDKFSGESRGFAFVEMPTKAEAEAAINDLNGKEQSRSRGEAGAEAEAETSTADPVLAGRPS